MSSDLLYATFGEPEGVLGRLGTRLMGVLNAETERALVRLAAPGPGDTAVVVGPGGGVGLAAAGGRARLAVGVDPSAVVRELAAARCRRLVDAGRVRLVRGTAEHTGLATAGADLVLSVNNHALWTDRRAGIAELRRVLRGGGTLLLSGHERWIGERELAAQVRDGGFVDVQTWRYRGRFGAVAVQLRAVKPGSSGTA